MCICLGDLPVALRNPYVVNRKSKALLVFQVRVFGHLML